MSDRHIRILAGMARRSQGRLDSDDTSGPQDAVSIQQRVELRLRAARTRARLAAARARRA